MKTVKKHEELLASMTEQRSGDVDPQVGDLHELIERRAYEMYEQRGGSDGDALNDWFRAEAEIKAERETLTDDKTREMEKALPRAAYSARVGSRRPSANS